jgi:hypothetical protein
VNAPCVYLGRTCRPTLRLSLNSVSSIRAAEDAAIARYATEFCEFIQRFVR